MTRPPPPLALLHRLGMRAFFRPQEAESLGVSYSDLRWLLRDGDVECTARGLYRLTAAEPTEHYTLAAVTARVPRSIVCLASALRVHGIGSAVPADVWLAIPHKARAPRIRDTRVRFLRFSGAAWTWGIERIEFEGVPAQITDAVRTVLDCFRFERLVGRETAREALRDALRQRKVTTDALYRALEVLPSRRLSIALDGFVG